MKFRKSGPDPPDCQIQYCFDACIELCVARARLDIERIKQVQRESASQASGP